MDIFIRHFRPGDAAALAGLMHSSVHANAAKAYTPAQLAAWSPHAMDADTFLTRISDGRTIWVAQQADTPIGFIELETSGHIDRFYCHPAGIGVGSALYQAMEREAVAYALARLSVNASEAARQFFLNVGFTVQMRRQVWRRGVMLHNYAMEKMLP